MRALLALELSSDPSTLAVAYGGQVKERGLSGERGRALLTEIDALLGEAGLRKSQLAGVLAGTGPGSYTGLRIACAAARTLAFGLSIPCSGLCSFAAAALEAEPGSVVHLLQDAYREEVYHAVYRRTAGGVVEETAPRVLSRRPGRRAVPSGALLIGDPSLCEESPVVLSRKLHPTAGRLLELLGPGILASGRLPRESLAAPVPLYLRAAARRRAPRGAGSGAG